MAVVTKKSTLISNRDDIPAKLTNAEVSGGVVKEAQGFVDAANGDSATSVFKLLSIPSGARLSSLKLYCEALGAGAVVDIGAYRNTRDGGAVVDADFFATNVDVSAALAPVEVLNEAGNVTPAKREMALWEMLGMSADPKSTIDICATVDVAIAANGAIGAIAQYV